MKMKCVLATALAAGCACSAYAQVAEVGAASKQRSPAARKTRVQHAQHVVHLEPSFVRVNGVEVPFTTGSGDASVLAYDNVPPFNGPMVYTFANAGSAALDDITLSTSGPQRITGVRVSFGTGAVVAAPTGTVAVRVQWFNALDPTTASGPVNTNPNLDVLIGFATPTAGWAANTIYTATNFAFFPNNITTSSTGALALGIYNSAGTAFNTDFTPVYDSSPMTIGSSQNLAWIDANNDGVYEASEAVEAPAPDIAKFRLALHVETPDQSAGACCIPGGPCILTSSALCATQNGTFQGSGTTCAAGACFTAPVLWNNGPLATGTVTFSGNTAPAGTQWSEGVFQENCAVGTAGFAATNASNFRLADNFRVPAGQSWNLQNVTVYGYQTGGSATVSPFNGITLRILNGEPSNPASQAVWGDASTNLYANSTVAFANIYRTFSTATNAANANQQRPIWSFQVPVNATLPAGQYYLDYSLTSATAAAVWSPPVSPMYNNSGIITIEQADAAQRINATTWVDLGMGTTGAFGASGCMATRVELPFIVRGTSTGGPSCYANCDGSTTVPFLNVADFGCFLSKFAAGDGYANCDGSTTQPVLNVADFGCFLGKFAAGCSAP